MSARRDDSNEDVVDKLCAAYRAAVEDPAYGAGDQALLRAAARAVRGWWVGPTVYVAAVLLIATLGLAMFAITAPHRLQLVGRSAGIGNIARYFTESVRQAAVPLPTEVVHPVSSQSAQAATAQASAHPAPLQAGCAAAGSCGGGAARAGSGPPLRGFPASGGSPKPSDFLVAFLKAAEQAIKAHNYELGIQNLQWAQAAGGQETAYDEFIINAMLGMAYYQEHDYARAAPALDTAAQSQYATPQQRQEWLQAAESMRGNKSSRQ